MRRKAYISSVMCPGIPELTVVPVAGAIDERISSAARRAGAALRPTVSFADRDRRLESGCCAASGRANAVPDSAKRSMRICRSATSEIFNVNLTTLDDLYGDPSRLTVRSGWAIEARPSVGAAESLQAGGQERCFVVGVHARRARAARPTRAATSTPATRACE